MNHEAIEELLAGYALRSLSGEDAASADLLLTEHVPGCASCRETLQAFGRVAGDLGLEPPPVEPPQTLLPRLRRELEPRSRGRALRSGRIVAAAAGLVLVVGLGGLAVNQLGGGSDPSVQPLTAQDLADVVSFATQPGTQTHDLGQAREISHPGVEGFYVWGDDVPAPLPGMVYRLWAVSGTDAVFLHEFVPDVDGMVLLRVQLDPSTFDRLLVTEEPAGSEASTPGEPAWAAAG